MEATEKSATPRWLLGAIVLIGGLVSSALTMAGLYYLRLYAGFNLMAWHVLLVLPIGALVCGVVAGLGYGFASLRTGLRVGVPLLVVLALLQVAVYFTWRYADFVSRGPLVSTITHQHISYWQHIDLVATGIVWKIGADRTPLGAMGYGVLALEILGFVAGSVFFASVCSKSPYCEECQVFRKSRELCTIPCRVVEDADFTGRVDAEARQREAEQSAAPWVSAIRDAAAGGNHDLLCQHIDALARGSAAAAKMPARIAISLTYCPRCKSGCLRPILVIHTGKSPQIELLPKIQVDPVAIEHLCPA